MRAGDFVRFKEGLQACRTSRAGLLASLDTCHRDPRSRLVRSASRAGRCHTSAEPSCHSARDPAAALSGGSLPFVRTELFFGTARRGGAVTEEEFQSFIDSEVTPRFPEGLTLFKANGRSRRVGDAIVKEQSFVLVLLYPYKTRGRGAATRFNASAISTKPSSTSTRCSASTIRRRMGILLTSQGLCPRYPGSPCLVKQCLFGALCAPGTAIRLLLRSATVLNSRLEPHSGPCLLSGEHDDSKDTMPMVEWAPVGTSGGPRRGLFWRRSVHRRRSVAASAIDDERLLSAGQRLFEKETFGGNGRTCLTCHSRETGTISAADAQRRFASDASIHSFAATGAMTAWDTGRAACSPMPPCS